MEVFMLYTISRQNLDSTGIHNPTFHISKMLGDFNIGEFCGDNVHFNDTKTNQFFRCEPIKMMQTNANFKLTQEVIEELLHAPKYIVESIVQTSTFKPNRPIITTSSEFVKNEDNQDVSIDYYISEDNKDGTYNEFYQKNNMELTNKGVFFLLSMISGKPHMFALNVITSGQTGKSASLMYLPNGNMNNAILLERICYHGKNGNEHVNSDGTIIEKDDLHYHIASQKYFEFILNNMTLTDTEKIIKLNGPDAVVVKSHALSDEANISAIVNMAIKHMNIEGLLPQLYIDDNCDIGENIYHAIQHAHLLSMC